MCLDEKHKKLGVNSTKILELGEMLKRGGSSVKDAINMPEEEILIQDRRNYNMIRKIKNDYQNMPMKFTDSYKPDIEVIYICGDSDAGKTKYVYDMMKKR